MYVCIHACMWLFPHVCMWSRMRAQGYVFMYVYVCMWLYLYVCVCVCVCLINITRLVKQIFHYCWRQVSKLASCWNQVYSLSPLLQLHACIHTFHCAIIHCLTTLDIVHYQSTWVSSVITFWVNDSKSLGAELAHTHTHLKLASVILQV